MVEGRSVRPVAMLAGTVAYLSRPWSCTQVLGTFSPSDNVPYANFDRHGMGSMIGWLLALVFAPPVFWLAHQIVTSFKESSSTSLGRGTMIGSALVAFALGFPTFSQIAYLWGLPVTLVWPVWVSSLLWMFTVAALWIAFIGRTDARVVDQRLKNTAVLLAAIIALPKTVIVAMWAVDAAT